MFDLLLLIGITAIGVLLSVFHVLRHERIAKHINGQFAGPRSYPIFGNLLQFGFTPDGKCKCQRETLIAFGV